MVLKSAILPDIGQSHEKLTEWRRDIHAHPELGFQENRTAALVAERLHKMGIEVHTNIGKTGVVGRLTKGSSARAVGLRADMDALPIQEENDFAHRSQVDGVFHGCGHDGHTVMLLGAADYLAKKGQFDGTVYFIFQPAEEGQGGGSAMIEDGLFDKFPMDQVYGMHNSPGYAVGSFAGRPGPFLAGMRLFDIHIKGVGGHGAMPHLCVDPLVMASEIHVALQTIVSRSLDPMEMAVVSVGKLRAGDAYNVIPGFADMAGTIRFLTDTVGELLMRRMAEIVRHISEAHRGSAEVIFHQPGYPPLINDQEAFRTAMSVAKSMVGDSQVADAILPVMGSEDFAFMLQKKAGCYILIGNGQTGAKGGCMVHHPRYDFNDDILPLGATYWAKLVQQVLPVVSTF